MRKYIEDFKDNTLKGGEVWEHLTKEEQDEFLTLLGYFTGYAEDLTKETLKKVMCNMFLMFIEAYHYGQRKHKGDERDEDN